MCNSEKEKRIDKNITVVRINNEEEFQKFKTIYQSGYGTGLTRGLKLGIVLGCMLILAVEFIIHVITSLIF